MTLAHKHRHNILLERIGTKIVRATFGLSPQALHNWRTRGIPITKRIAFAKVAAERGVAVPEDFFEEFELKDAAA